ncbi:DUF6798 domain-containing protein [Radicibacter daui]|uniref:DUF6798 domain-containing protein n=1 Tax=Radicibacter daui TaxID=3064829 RepID=UPI00404701FD
MSKKAGNFINMYYLLFILVAACISLPRHPLFSDNQNTKLLYGLAKASYGNLRHDWLLKITNTLPFFDALVFAVHQFLWDGIFSALYIACGLLLVYAGLKFSSIQEDRAAAPLYSLTVGMWLVALFANNATGRLFEGVAHQYILGHVFEPSNFGVLTLFAVFLFCARKPGWSVTLMVIAAWIHNAYIAPGLMLMLGMLIARWRFGGGQAPFPLFTLLGGIGGCLCAPLFSYSLLAPIDPQAQLEAFRIITTERIPEHSLPEIWFGADAAFKAIAVAAAVWLLRRHPLGWILGFVEVLIVLASLWVWIMRDFELAFAAPWRASVIIVPIANAVLIGKAFQWLSHKAEQNGRYQKAQLGLVVVAVVATGIFAVSNYHKLEKRAQHPAYYAWVQEHAQPKDVFLNDPNDSNFRLATGQPQYISWKTHPYRGQEVLEWSARVAKARAATGKKAPSCQNLDALAGEAVTHLVRPATSESIYCPDWKQAYADKGVVIYQHQPAGN